MSFEQLEYTPGVLGVPDSSGLTATQLCYRGVIGVTLRISGTLDDKYLTLDIITHRSSDQIGPLSYQPRTLVVPDLGKVEMLLLKTTIPYLVKDDRIYTDRYTIAGTVTNPPDTLSLWDVINKLTGERVPFSDLAILPVGTILRFSFSACEGWVMNRE